MTENVETVAGRNLEQDGALIEQMMAEEALREEIREELKNVLGARARVELFAEMMDKYGLDAVLGMVPLPVAPEAATAVAQSVYLLAEAGNAGLSKMDMLKIVGLETADFFVGVAGMKTGVLDYLFKANKQAAKYFARQEEAVVARAKELGLTEEQIAEIRQEASIFPRIGKKVLSLDSLGKSKEKSV